ncbi:MAG: hypothetical protein M1812_004904 [Candelaria pacifica]|nr:MAG: hypothetical protein M1812_004904 [Candelaria pacifica]
MYTQLLLPLSSLFFSSTLFPSSAHAFQDCLLLGAKYQAPQNPSKNPSVTAAKFSLAQQIQQGLQNGSSAYGPFPSQNSFSIDVFSVNEADSIFSYYHSHPSVANATSGVKKADANTIYRIGSISKLFTVFVFLVEAGDARWNDPITRYIPELLAPNKAQDSSQPYNPVNQVSWSDITIGALASQMAGVGRENSLNDFAAGNSTTAFGFPPVSAGDVPACGASTLSPPCNRKAFFDGFLNRHPVVAPFSTPIYSNIAYQLLAYALESISKRPFKDLFQDKLVKPLNLTQTSLTKPSNDSMGLIGEGANANWWKYDMGDEGTAAGAYSSSSEMAAIGRAILKSTLLPPAQTRRWMKPHSHTSSLTLSIGAPWEIVRTKVGNNLVDLYTKIGDIGFYSSALVLIPDYDVGFSVLVAGGQPTPLRAVLTDMIAQALLPALDSAARSEADTTYSGRYVSAIPSLNSSITLSTDSGKAGLVVSNWVSNGTDIINSLNDLVITSKGPTSGGTRRLNVRLLPNNLQSPQSSNGTQEIGFRATFEDTSAPDATGIFSRNCGTWAAIDSLIFKGVAIDDFSITLGSDGKAVNVFPKIFGVRLLKS